MELRPHWETHPAKYCWHGDDVGGKGRGAPRMNPFVVAGELGMQQGGEQEQEDEPGVAAAELAEVVPSASSCRRWSSPSCPTVAASTAKPPPPKFSDAGERDLPPPGRPPWALQPKWQPPPKRQQATPKMPPPPRPLSSNRQIARCVIFQCYRRIG